MFIPRSGFRIIPIIAGAIGLTNVSLIAKRLSTVLFAVLPAFPALPPVSAYLSAKPSTPGAQSMLSLAPPCWRRNSTQSGSGMNSVHLRGRCRSGALSIPPWLVRSVLSATIRSSTIYDADHPWRLRRPERCGPRLRRSSLSDRRASAPGAGRMRSGRPQCRSRLMRCRAHALPCRRQMAALRPEQALRRRTACLTASPRVSAHRGTRPRRRAGLPISGHDRQLGLIMVRETGVDLFIARWHCDPALQPMEGLAACATFRRRAFGMDDAAAGGHPVDRASPYWHRGAKAVAVHDFTVEQIGEGRKPNVRMRPHIDALTLAETAGPKWSKKINGPTMRRRACGSARRTEKSPRSTLRGTMMSSMASQAGASPGAGSLPGKKLMAGP